ncbi:hypothetical protein O181_070413 [Austropuccinia psidii MF-1]|uniref:Uncharacterized protein n=1 Tax=Austropuccinia psidii MF-1 TaxID=1389203 RepID=A0A9Q3F3V8_9BASI|nr:hypothetical protein [Austropuccinia psidii MF-1]
MNEPLSQPISSFSDIRGMEKLNSSNFFTWQRGIGSSLSMRNLRDMLLEPPSSVKIDPIYLKEKEMVYYFIVGHLDDENYNKFVSNKDEEPYQLWNSIKEHYPSSSGENIASHFGKLFSIKFHLPPMPYLRLSPPFSLLLNFLEDSLLAFLLLKSWYRFLHFMYFDFSLKPEDTSPLLSFILSKFQSKFPLWKNYLKKSNSIY